ncbi:uncharacterized protein T551_03340 [Pneumocystis jirovecii RU7]|uniref:Sec20 C-terminal domain-containing protein n=1 Tax=Pneumocystis jirovecii (strain RU7) TaxID=1408657 RepID=A0A0W4ZEV1_PNEJ7|nr:uncharacterized protein T551_03340 [Pneumocystis jirovecii RU7]KTW26878.1 hypothetical protein T551_03340 [Pneumocystis jirovecii RU7]
MDFKNELRSIKKCYWEVVDLIQKLGRISEFSGENLEKLGLEIRVKLKQTEAMLEKLFVMLEDLEDEEIKAEYLEICNKLKDDLKISRQDFRKALLKLNQNMHLKNQKDREQLLGDAKERATILQKRTKDMKESSYGDRAVNASSNVLSALIELHQLMESEMSRSAVTLEELESSSNTLQSLQENYLTFGTLLTKSRKLLSELEYANKFDRFLIIFSLIFFLLVVGWIIYKRLLRHLIHTIFWIFFVKLRDFSKKVIIKIYYGSLENYNVDSLKFSTSNQKNLVNSTFLHDEI